MKNIASIFGRRVGSRLGNPLGWMKRTAAGPVPENWHEKFITHLGMILRPKVYVELGLYRCELFNRMVPFAERLIGVDRDAAAGAYMEKAGGKTEFFRGTTDEFADRLARSPLKIDLLFIDADHSKESVKRDFDNFFPFVSDHGLLLFHDSFPKNRTYTLSGCCGDGHLAIDELSKETGRYEMVTIPVHPGLTICRKRIHHLPWLSGNETL